MRIGIVCRTPGPTATALAAVRISGTELLPLTPAAAVKILEPGDAVLGRLDVLPTLDGIEEGLWALGVLAARGLSVLNGPATLIATHDKLVTARLLRRAGLPHPPTRHVRRIRREEPIARPVVLKPRYGSWGRHVILCATDDALRDALDRVREEPWFLEHGALVQQLVPPTGNDLRLIVAGNRVVGAVRREAAVGEWRTNVALGARRYPVEPPLRAVSLAVAAAQATGGALVGVDLLPMPDGEFTILEINGAVDFTSDYRPHGDVFREAALEISQLARSRVREGRPPSGEVLLV